MTYKRNASRGMGINCQLNLRALGISVSSEHAHYGLLISIVIIITITCNLKYELCGCYNFRGHTIKIHLTHKETRELSTKLN